MNKTITTVLVSLAVGLGLGYAWGSTQVAASYASKVAEVNKLFPAPTETLAVSGKVKQVTDSSIMLEGVSVSSNPFAGDFPTTRNVMITSATRIIKTSQKDGATLQAEMMAFQKSIQGSKGGVTITPPSPFSETDATLADIKVGDTVTVTATSNILSAASFSATQVQLASAVR